MGKQNGFSICLESFESVYAGAPLAAFVTDPEGRLITANAAFDNQLEGRWDEVKGQEIWHLSPSISEADFRRVRSELSHAGQEAVRMMGCRLSDGPQVAIADLYFIPFLWSETEPVALIVHVIDAKHVQKLEAEIQRARATLDTTEALFRASTKASHVGLWSVCPETGKTWFSDMWYEQLGYAPDSFEASFEKFLELMHPEDHQSTMDAYNALIEKKTDHYMADFRLRHADGSWRWIGARGANMEDKEAGRAALICGTQLDITGRKDTEARLAQVAQEALEHRARLDQLADNSPVGLFEFRMLPDGSVEFPYISDAVLDNLGVTRSEVDKDGSASFRNLLPEYVEPVSEAIELSRKELLPFRFRYRIQHPKRGIVWLQANSVPTRLEDQSTTWHGSVYDITPEVKREAELQEARDQALQMQEQMEELALHDVLTGLPNRRFFDVRLKEERTRARDSENGAVTLIRVDLDHFKYVNDNLGHDAGDAVLVHVGNLIKDGIRKNDFVSRIGGDEFSIILGDGGDTDLARDIVRRIHSRVLQPFHYGDQICRFGASFGIATCDAETVDEGELHAFADAALYEAKQKGRNRVEVFTRSLHAHIIENRHLTLEIEAALEREEFEPVYQPQFCARKRTLVGLETLARWRHPTRGILLPGQFMDVAEQIRAVPIIDQMMLEKSHEILSWWRENGFVPPKISFNVSSGRLRDPEILNVARRMQETGTVIAFELLESILIEDENDEFRFNLDAMKDSGIQVEIDDFGSGHASIIGVMEAEPSVLKIDKRLSCNVVENPQARELIAAIIRIGSALGISVTVEGVETPQQAAVLTDLGCDTLQGFLYSKPLTAVETLEFSRRFATAIG
ncbi:MAG: EAL domain-containing protein [Roseobacter sp.]